MATADNPRSIRVVRGEIENRSTTTRIVLPSSAQPVWPPFRLVGESLASQGRQMPAHAHEREEVLTYLTDGIASYQLESTPPEPLRQGAARLLTAPTRVTHRVSPVEGGAIHWVNLVVGLPRASAGPPILQALNPDVKPVELDDAWVRPLVGTNAPMKSAGGLECQEIAFTQESTTFRRVGPQRRAVVYALGGEGSVDQRKLEGGEAALVEGVPGIAVHGDSGFRVIVASAPT